MAAKKKSAGKSAGGRKGEFVLSMPETMSAQQIVAEAKKAGITLTDSYVYKLRRKGGGGAKKGGSAAKGGAAPKGKRAATGRSGSASDFVRSLPAGISAKEAVDQAKAAGIKLTTGYFYTLKSSLGLAGSKRGPKPKAAAAQPTRGKPGPKPKAATAARNGGGSRLEEALIEAAKSLTALVRTLSARG